MSRAFIENGKWQGLARQFDDLPAHGKATLRGSALAGLMTLALFAAPEFSLPESMTQPTSAPVIGAPELVSHKSFDRVSPTEEVTGSFTRRKPRVDEDVASVAEAAKPFIAIQIVDALTLRAGDMTVRLAGLASPEASMICRRLDGLSVPCKDRASSYLELLVKGRSVACDRAGLDADGVEKGRCRIGGTDLAEQMTRQGWARAEDRSDRKLVVAEAAARKQKLGIWRE